jgi:hypothetical protein
VSIKIGLKLVPRDGVDVCMGVTVRPPSVGCCSIELVCDKITFSRSMHWATTSFFSTFLSQSLTFIRSLACVKVVG